MYRFTFDSKTGCNGNQKEYAELSRFDAKVPISDRLQVMGLLQKVQEIRRDPEGWLMRNGPEVEFLYWSVVAEESNKETPRGQVGLLLFKWAVMDWVLTNQYQFVKKDGNDWTDNDLLEYTTAYGFSTDDLPNVLIPRDENSEDDEDEYSGEPVPVPDETTLELRVNSDFFDRVLNNTKVQVVIPLRKVIAFMPNIYEQLNWMQVTSVTAKNGDVNKRKAKRLMRRLMRKGGLKLTKEQEESKAPCFRYEWRVDDNAPVKVTMFDTPFALKASQCPILDTKTLKQQHVEAGADMRRMDEDDLLRRDTFHFLGLMGKMRMEAYHPGRGFGIPSVNDVVSLEDVFTIQDGKIVCNVRTTGNMDEEVRQMRCWSEIGQNYVFMSDKNYTVVHMGRMFLCYVEE